MNPIKPALAILLMTRDPTLDAARAVAIVDDVFPRFGGKEVSSTTTIALIDEVLAAHHDRP